MKQLNRIIKKNRKLKPVLVKCNENNENIPPEQDISVPLEQNTQSIGISEALFTPRKLVIEYRYSLNNKCTKWICIGLDPAQNFQVTIRLLNIKHDKRYINFNNIEWNEFLACHNFIESFYNNTSNIESYRMLNNTLYFESFDNSKVILIESVKSNIYLDIECTKNLFFLVEITSCIIKFFESLNMYNYYKNIITQAVNITDNDNLFLNISTFINSNNNIQAVAITEMLLFYSDVLLDDIVHFNC